jgi:hypothetical protein
MDIQAAKPGAFVNACQNCGKYKANSTYAHYGSGFYCPIKGAHCVNCCWQLQGESYA